MGESTVRITNLFVRPDLQRKRITVETTASGPGLLQFAIEGTPYEASGDPGKLTVDFPEFEHWTPDTPKLYTLKCTLVDNETTVDEASVRFGMREFNVRDNRFYLNNRVVYLKGTVFGGNAEEFSEGQLRGTLQSLRKAGFNFVFTSGEAIPPTLLDAADELGLLVQAQAPIGFVEKSEGMQERCERAVREMVLRDRNHPSVVIWGMLDDSGDARLVRDDLCRIARELDPSRLVIDESGGAVSTRQPARLMRPYHSEFETFDDLRVFHQAPVTYEGGQYLLNSGDGERIGLISRTGFAGIEDLGAIEQESPPLLENALEAIRTGFAERGLDRVFGDLSALAEATRHVQCDAAERQIDAMRANLKLAGYCYGHLRDASRGLFDRNGAPKPVVERLERAQRPIRPHIHVARTNLLPREEVSVRITLANEEHLEGRVDLSLQIVGPTKQVLWKKRRAVKVPRPGKELWNGSVAASGSTGVHRFVVRLMGKTGMIAENSVELHVFPPVEASEIEINTVDTEGDWLKRCGALAKTGTPHAPIHIVPPLANTIRAYPDNELAHVLAQVDAGAVALFFSPPDDWNDFARQLDERICATGRAVVGQGNAVYHYVKLHPVFEDLPARTLMENAYRNVVPRKTFVEPTDEDICGSLDTARMVSESEVTPWGSNILVRRYGSGRIVFTHLRVLENLGRDPLADRLFVNMLKHSSRRSVPTEGMIPVHRESVEWLRRESARVRRWMVIGMFANWNETGHETAYPPEKEVRLEATYPGWCSAVRWKQWYSRAEDDHEADLVEALLPLCPSEGSYDYGTAYAYSEFTCERRVSVKLLAGTQNPVKVWLNGNLVHDKKVYSKPGDMDSEAIDTYIREGRNTLLVKVSKTPGPCCFSVDFEPLDKDPLTLNWWK